MVEKIYIAPRGGAGMQAVEEVDALAGCGLRGDRYCQRSGYWTGVDECEVTLIEAEDLDEIRSTTGIHVENGEHRRNLVTRDIRLESLAGRRFRVGEAVLEFDRPRPPCGYIQSITERGMTKALLGRGGVCARVIQSGTIRAGDPIVILSGESKQMKAKITKSEQEWRTQLTPEQFEVCRKKGTERPFTGEYYDSKKAGIYRCACCGNELFRSEQKFDSGTGWPSFWAPIGEESVATESDSGFGMRRTEVLCSACDAHLGHVFPDGPAPTGLRYCINSVALKLEENS